jgi:hypothetical protein
MILVPPQFALKILSFVLLTVTSQNGCGKYLSVSNCVLRSSEVTGGVLVSVTKHEAVVLELRGLGSVGMRGCAELPSDRLVCV